MFQQHGKYTCTIANIASKKRVHVTFEDGVEMVEEYANSNGQLTLRKWKAATSLRKGAVWEFEIGDAQPDAVVNPAGTTIAPNCANPIFTPRDHRLYWEWRIRNLPYPKETYSLKVALDNTEIVVQTSNRKYYKRFKIPSLCRLNLKIDEGAMSMSHGNSTLVIQYTKPDAVVELESKEKQLKMRSTSNKEGEVDCKQQ